jgi:carboxyl-terminal processing protease
MGKKRTKYILVTLLAAAILFVMLEMNFLPNLFSQSAPPKPFEILGWVIKLIRDDYVEVPDASKTMSGAYKGLVDSLDPLSSYLDAEGVTRYRTRMRGPFLEPGLVLYKKYRAFPLIVGIEEGSPAARADLKLGTPVFALDGKSTLEMSMLEIDLLLKSTASVPVELKLDQGTDTEELVPLEREPLYSEPFEFRESEGLSGILKLRSLYPPLVERLKKDLVERLKKSGKPLVLDMRNCNEGTLEQTAALINLFLNKDNIGYLEKSGGEKQTLACTQAAELPDLPLFIWTNQATMGPAEMAASVLHEHRGAKVLGAQTLGMVAQQQFFALEDGSGLVLTSAIFLPTSQTAFWEKGLTPDVKIAVEDQTVSSYLQETRKLASRF